MNIQDQWTIISNSGNVKQIYTFNSNNPHISCILNTKFIYRDINGKHFNAGKYNIEKHPDYNAELGKYIYTANSSLSTGLIPTPPLTCFCDSSGVCRVDSTSGAPCSNCILACGAQPGPAPCPKCPTPPPTPQPTPPPTPPPQPLTCSCDSSGVCRIDPTSSAPCSECILVCGDWPGPAPCPNCPTPQPTPPIQPLNCSCNSGMCVPDNNSPTSCSKCIQDCSDGPGPAKCPKCQPFCRAQCQDYNKSCPKAIDCLKLTSEQECQDTELWKDGEYMDSWKKFPSDVSAGECMNYPFGGAPDLMACGSPKTTKGFGYESACIWEWGNNPTPSPL